VLTPAAVVAYLFARLMGFVIIGTPSLVWHWTIRLLEPSNSPYDFPGRPKGFSTGVIAGIAALYVFAVVGAAFYQLPRIMFAITKAAD
jgi:hypothetical protein